jgi:tetratricopeptide (TPR) repeat protein
MFAKNKTLKIILIIIGALALILAIYFIPAVKRRVDWNIFELRSKIFYFFNPPGETAFSPAQQEEMEAIVNMTLTSMADNTNNTEVPSITPTNYVSPTPTLTATQTPSPTPIPNSVKLEGVVWQNQKIYNNNCGPANLSMALSYWGWDVDQSVTAAWLKPNPEDRNVMPYEMVDYIESQTDLSVVLRLGGDLDLIKKFIAAGFPVLIERGYVDEVPQGGWMGHYNVITGYDEEKQVFIIQDSYVSPDYKNSYSKIEEHWQEFNYVYLIIYPDKYENKVYSILGPHADETYNLEHTTQKALEETTTKTGLERFFAWFNYGSGLRRLNDYFGAARAFDKAYAILEDEFNGVYTLYRIIWYRTDPYFAYYYTERYQDVIDLATLTRSYSFRPGIEETWVWQGRAKYKLGDVEGAIEDFRTALKWHPGWWVAENELQLLGVEP